MRLRRSRVIVIGALLLAAALAWLLRWQIGSGTFRIVEPAVRGWAVAEVARLSDSVYALSLSAVRLTADGGRVALDDLHLTTDPQQNASRPRPYPDVDLRLHGCAIDGIDLDRLAAGNGLWAQLAGCDSAAATIRVPPNVVRDTANDGAFLALRDSLRLPASIPWLLVEMVRLPNLRLDLTIEAPSGEHTRLAFGRLQVIFDSVAWDPATPPEDRRTLLSRDVRIVLVDAEGSRGTDRLTVAGLRASFADSTLELDDLAWSPLAGTRSDSLRLTGVTVDSVAVQGVDWEAALVSGDLVLRRVLIDRLDLRTTPSGPGHDRAAAAGQPWTLEKFLAALHRTVAIDTATARDITVRHGGTGSVTTAGGLLLTGVRHAPADTGRGLPPLRLAAGQLVHAWGDQRARVDSLRLDLVGGTIDASGIRFATLGTDSQFTDRRKWRSDRVTLDASRLRVRGLDGGAWHRGGAYRAHLLAVEGLRLDVFSDKRLPSRPTSATHRTPQDWLRTLPVVAALDTAVIRGSVTYREHGEQPGKRGELHFSDLTVSLADFTSGPGRASRPIRFLATARLMGQAPFQLEATLPRGAGFDLAWSGRLAAMPAAALNPILTGVSDIAFAGGSIDWIEFEAETHDGYSVGTVRPRYRDLDVSLPGVGRTGALGGVRRAIAGVVANSFVLRGDNRAGGDSPPVDGRIEHRWDPSETLVQHLWVALRQGLRLVITP